MRHLTFIVFFFFSISLFGQKNKQTTQFKKAEYPSSKYTTQFDTSLLGQVQIIIIMTHPKRNSSANFLCRSWLTIKKNNKVLKQEYYDIEPVGGCSGLYKPTKQLCKNYFIFSKFGDYQGETLLIDTTGKLTILQGGSFSISKDSNFLFTIYDSDISGITVYDLKNKKEIFTKESEDEAEYQEFYFQDNKYYVSTFNEENSKEVAVGFIDLKNKKVSITKQKNTFLKKSNRLNIFNSIKSLEKCNCGE